MSRGGRPNERRGDTGRDGRGALRRSLPDPRASRNGAERALVADGGSASDAPQQPRPGGRRASRAPRRVRRHREGGAEPRRAPGDRPNAPQAPRGRDAARPERQAGRRLPYDRGGAPGADRERAARAALGVLGRVPPPRGRGAHDVRADDRRELDLHRHPGDPAGHVPDLRCGRREALRLPGPDGKDDPHRRPRRDGRRAAARRDDGGRAILCVEVDPTRIERRLETRYLDEAADSLDDALARVRTAAREGRALSVGCSGTPPTSSPSSRTAARPSTSSPTRPRRTTR